VNQFQGLAHKRLEEKEKKEKISKGNIFQYLSVDCPWKYRK